MKKGDEMENKKNYEQQVQSCCSSKNKKGIQLKHIFMMGLCCLLPIIIILVLPVFGIEKASWSVFLFMLCPLMHIGMMFFMKERK